MYHVESRYADLKLTTVRHAPIGAPAAVTVHLEVVSPIGGPGLYPAAVTLSMN